MAVLTSKVIHWVSDQYSGDLTVLNSTMGQGNDKEERGGETVEPDKETKVNDMWNKMYEIKSLLSPVSHFLLISLLSKPVHNCVLFCFVVFFFRVINCFIHFSFDDVQRNYKKKL